jgi:hypothetical protein
MSEDDSGLLVPNQLVGSDQTIQGVIHCGQLALARLEQLLGTSNFDTKAMERAVRAGPATAKSSKHVSKRAARGGRQ